MIYFAQVPSGPIKIGFAAGHEDDISERIKTLQCGNNEKMTVIAWTFGGQKEEKAFHKELAGSRMSGEWFRPTKEVWATMLVHCQEDLIPELEQTKPKRETKDYPRFYRNRRWRFDTSWAFKELAFHVKRVGQIRTLCEKHPSLLPLLRYGFEGASGEIVDAGLELASLGDLGGSLTRYLDGAREAARRTHENAAATYERKIADLDELESAGKVHPMRAMWAEE